MARQRQIEQRYRKDRQRNVLARPGCHDFVFVLDRLKAGFNVPKIFRSAQAFGAAGIHLVDIGVFDTAPAKGAFRKVPAHFHETFDQAWQALETAGYTCFALTADGDESLPEVILPRRSAFVVGHEERGLSFDPADFPGMRTLRIPLYGEMESLNASIAASVVMYEYVRQHGEKP
ncbi:MAG: TrmH family RNA methyltransferase [Gammaproteobacteria bacterium]|nr:MAG: TrmH family RNA methyltransferase [Gammaproteobacteria bacterium]